jgi:hypothetical protein
MIPRILLEIPDPDLYRMRYDLNRPFIDGDWLIATDGRIMARSPLSRFTAAELRPYGRDGRKLLDPGRTTQVWDGFIREPRGEPVSLPESIRDREACDRCFPGREWDWPFIPASGRYCEHCDGDGWLWVVKGINLGPVTLQPRYAALLSRHGVSKVYPGAGADRPVYFEGDGFEGILMPYDPKYIGREIPADAGVAKARRAAV